ncbi:hypothetical protein HID58_080303, partial [Brassica napus]
EQVETTMDFQHHCQFIILLNVERFSKMFPLMLLFRTPRLTISASEDLASSLLHSDAYQATGCYNFLCSDFIQINSNIAMEASISPVSGYCNLQYDISILIWKDPKEH